MLATSPRWAPALRANHAPVHRIELWRQGTLLIRDLKVESGTVTKDASAAPRTSATLTVADTSPATAQVLTPFGYRLKFYRGLRYPDNTTELVLYADLDIVRSRFSRPSNRLEVTLSDPSALIAGDILPGPFRQANIMSSAQDTITWLIDRSVFYQPANATLVDSTAETLPLSADYVVDGSPWDCVEQLADTIGAECYFRPDRWAVLRPVPSLKSTPDALLYALAGGTVTAIDSELSRGPNVVYLWGAPLASGKASRGLAMDTDPNSPTYISAPGYGRVVVVETRPNPLTAAQAQSAATALLRRVQGKVRTVTVDAIPDPSLEPGDTVQVRYANGKTERHVIQSVSLPIGGGAGEDVMTVTTRTTAYTTAGWP